MNLRAALGTTIRIKAEVTDINDNFVDPDTRQVTIFKGSTEVLAYTNMDRLSLGKFYYRFQSSLSDPTGKYEVKVKTFRNSYTSIEHDERAFYLY